MSQVDISLFASIIQSVCIVGLAIYFFWFVSLYFFFIQTLNIFNKFINKSVQLIIILFNKF